jgi:hypothetical protein
MLEIGFTDPRFEHYIHSIYPVNIPPGGVYYPGLTDDSERRRVEILGERFAAQTDAPEIKAKVCITCGGSLAGRPGGSTRCLDCYTREVLTCKCGNKKHNKARVCRACANKEKKGRPAAGGQVCKECGIVTHSPKRWKCSKCEFKHSTRVNALIRLLSVCACGKRKHPKNLTCYLCSEDGARQTGGEINARKPVNPYRECCHDGIPSRTHLLWRGRLAKAV